MSDISKDTFNTIIGSGTRIHGNLNLQGLLRIDGDFEGSIKTDGRVLIGRYGRAQCIIEAGTVVIGGVVKGEIKVNGRIVLLSTCLVFGNIIAQELELEDGAIFHGNLTISEDTQVRAFASNGQKAGSQQSLFSADFGAPSSRKS